MFYKPEEEKILLRFFFIKEQQQQKKQHYFWLSFEILSEGNQGILMDTHDI